MSHLCLKQKNYLAKEKRKKKTKSKRKKKPFLVAVGKLTFPSFKLLIAEEEGGRKYQPTQGSEVVKQQMGGLEGT
jgi:hypothetical protein